MMLVSVFVAKAFSEFGTAVDLSLLVCIMGKPWKFPSIACVLPSLEFKVTVYIFYILKSFACIKDTSTQAYIFLFCAIPHLFLVTWRNLLFSKHTVLYCKCLLLSCFFFFWSELSFPHP